MIKIGAMNTPRNNLIDEIKWISCKGFDFIDMTIEPRGAYPNNISKDIIKIKKALKDYNLDAIGHTNPFLPSILPIPSIRKVCIDEFRKYVEIFSKLNIEYMNIHPYYDAPQFSAEEKIRANIELLKQVNKLCRAKGITLMLENYIAPFDNPEVFSWILREVKGLKVHLDVGHCNINQEQNLTGAFFRKFKKDIVHLHFSDNKGGDDDHLPLGCGYINWREIVKILKRYNYNRTITLEVFSPDRDYLLLSREKLKRWWR